MTNKTTITNRLAPLAAAALLVLSGAALAQDAKPFQLTIMHTNDTHAHHLPQGRSGDGGVARQATVVKSIREEVANSLLLDAGDRFTGTLFHKYYQGRENIQLMNALGYDAMALGNHEFDNGLEVLEQFVSAAQFPVLSANTDFGDLGALAEKVPGTTVLEVGGESIGIIGLVTAETPEITINFPGKENIKWTDDYAGVVNAAVEKLTEQGVNKIVLVTHIGMGVDMAVAAKVRGVDVIVGGHSHTVVSDIFKEGRETRYPMVVDDLDGKPVYIVQAGDRDRYLGRLNLRFDDEGNVTRARGDLVLLSRFITPDPEVKALVDELAKPIEKLQNTPVAGDIGAPVVSEQLLTNKSCRDGECLLGNLIADAIRAESGAQIVFQNGGGLRADIDEGEITVGEVLTVLPFGNTVATLKLKGADVRASLETGVSRVGGKSGTGRFPQVSGIKYSFDASRDEGARIVSVEVMNEDGGYTELQDEELYSIATNNFMRTGGDGYNLFADAAIDPYDFGRPIEEALIDYMIANSPVVVAKDGRIERLD